ncbi:MAG: DsbE family thiol:disulfide interchange protein [Pelagibacterales bacterium]|nr:DsbE family thiol:disulfide interchange protein [Pelagibacterales bacterium]
MKNKILLFTIALFLIFCFIILFKSLNNSNIYVPKTVSEKTLVNFNSKDFFSEVEISSDQIFVGNEFYILNIWSSWCSPCRDEHPKLMQLSKNSSVKLIGLNYKDNPKNAKKFIDILGNPYSMIIIDENGTISIELGAYGVPETYIISKDKKIIKKFIGPLSEESIKEINLILK